MKVSTEKIGNSQVVLNAVLPLKDPDVLCEKNLGSFYTHRLKVLPPVVGAIKFLLEKYQINLEGKNVLIIGRGQLVGKPVGLWFIHQRATVTVANSQTKNLENLIKTAEIIVSSAGIPGLIKGDMVQKGVVIFDSAVVSEAGKLKGDGDFDSLKDNYTLKTEYNTDIFLTVNDYKSYIFEKIT